MKVPPEYTKKVLEDLYGDRLHVYGDEWVIPSLENPRKLKLYVNPEKGKAIDFIGGRGYNVDTLLTRLLGIDRETLAERIIEWRLRNERTVEEYREAVEGKVETDLIEYPRKLAPLTSTCKRYLRERYIDPDWAEEYGFGYVLQDEANPKRDWGRLFIPSYSDGRLVYYQTRALGEDKIKYFGPKGVDKRAIVGNLHLIKDTAYIVEGIIDGIKIGGQTIYGSSISEQQARLIIERRPRRIVVVPDNDKPGYQGAIKTIETILRQSWPSEGIFLAFLERAKDIGELPSEEVERLKENVVPLNIRSAMKLFERAGRRSERIIRVL